MKTEDIQPFEDRLRLVELVDRVLDRGVMLRGDITISVAGIDLVYLELHLLLSASETLTRRTGPKGPPRRAVPEAAAAPPMPERAGDDAEGGTPD